MFLKPLYRAGLSRFSRVWVFVTLWTVACQSPLSMGFSRQECWSRLLCPPPGDLLNPEMKPVSLTSPALAGRFFNTSATWADFSFKMIEYKHYFYFAPYWKFFKRWEYQTTLCVSWEICMQVKKQQLKLDMEQWNGSKLEDVKAVYYHPAYLTYM